MTRDGVLEFCGTFPDAIEDYPFGDDVAVFKIAGRMFALVMLDGDPGRVNLKCDPDLALHLRATFPAVTHGTTPTSATETPWSWTAPSKTTSFAK